MEEDDMSSMNSNFFIPIAMLFVGWFLNSIVSEIFKGKSEHKKSLGKAIADLLEMRHEVIGRRLIGNEIRKRFKLGSQFEPFLQQIIDQLLPNSEDLHRRYNQTVDLIATIDPMLGFELRSKDVIKSFPNLIRKLTNNQSVPLDYLIHLENQLVSAALPVLEDVIKGLAWQHSLSTWWKVKGLFAKPPSLPEKCEEIFKSVELKIAELKEANPDGSVKTNPAIVGTS